MSNKKVLKLIKGQLSPEEEKEVIDWLFNNPKRREQYEILKAKHVAASLRKSKKTTFKKFYRYAALLAVILTSSILTWHVVVKNSISTIPSNSLVLITTQKAEKKEIILEDSTKITLNANSVLSYPKHFSGNTREVAIKGEAFFEVTKNTEKPFIVTTEDGMKIKVLGTSFNVKSYSEDKNVETTLVTGKVKVIEENKNTVVELSPSQKATYIKKEDKMIVEKVDVKNFTSWKEGKLIYNDTPMRQVIKDLERTYDLKFDVTSNKILDYKYKGEFDNLDIKQILDLFEVSSPITYSIQNNIIRLNIQK
ncbi:FecR family protein [Flavivirga spongiicola]|uniref:FecR domain-containing protein n=1 Tax=Flavivirga spongiicola TaxID=421621 RepID=A0ABU7XLK0_9FLAO|nr:FecR family protein [Flavivirga sp. MEBiC05379]MDO5981296.1 FecR domain-containing protein [Flavivirga sp. MEBiC05379]